MRLRNTSYRSERNLSFGNDPTFKAVARVQGRICFLTKSCLLAFRAGRTHVLLNAGLSASLKEVLSKRSFAVDTTTFASWQALMWARRRGVRFGCGRRATRKDARALRKPVESLKTRFLERCDGFVVPGKSAFEYLRSLGAPAERIFVAPNAVDNIFFAAQAEKVKRNRPHFEKSSGFRDDSSVCGKVGAKKGVFDLLQAYAKLERGLRSEVGLGFAGDGVSGEELAQRAKRISPGTVCFFGIRASGKIWRSICAR